MTDSPDQREVFLNAAGHSLVMGGPGSGKTTIALFKAERAIGTKSLRPRQKVLFLSFARATVARVAERARAAMSASSLDAIEINTYHGFAWNLLRSHGYLLTPHKRLRPFPPPDAAARLADIPDADHENAKRRFLVEEGLLHFDLFAAQANLLLSKSDSLASITGAAYPLVILDEFQDTNPDEWQMIQTIGKRSTLITLADPDQRIYEFRGADPRRILEFIHAFAPAQFDFGVENHRSNGTDICSFGNDLLTGVNKGKTYKNVSVKPYGFYHGKSQFFSIKAALIDAMKRQNKARRGEWAIAVLLPSKQLMLGASDYLSSTTDGLPEIQHEVAIDAEGPSLAAALIASVMDGSLPQPQLAHQILVDLCSHMRGRKGGKMSQADATLAGALATFLETGALRGPKRKAIVEDCRRIAMAREALPFTGDPGNDWLAVRALFAESAVDCITSVAEDAKYLRLLHKGAILRSRLADIWRQLGNYSGAARVVQNAMLQEHFAASIREWRGIHVMTIHKSKGKEFDEVIIYEGRYQGRFVRDDDEVSRARARLALRVAVTRAKERTTIFTPQDSICELL